MQEFATRKAIAQWIDLRLLNCFFRKYRVAVRIMKLTTIILLTACLQLSARGLTQTVTISVKDAPLLTVLKAIKKQTGFVFFISSTEIKRAKNVSITAKNLPLEQVLDLCFKDQPLTYKITGRWINIIPRIQQVEKDDKASYTAPLPQNIDVSGKVMDESGGPLAGANVVEKGKQRGTVTNADGVFVLKGVDENGSLEISFVGYQTLTVPVNNRSSIVVSLKQSENNLTEVVINKGYYTEYRKFSTGNSATVTSKEIEQQPVQNPLLALQGRVPGIEITQVTGMNGGAVNVRIQGLNSIGGLNVNSGVGTSPLIVIDNVPFPPTLLNSNLEGIVQGGSPLNYVNPNDIESISVLKDADATAIYGSRAANGAIIITTKKGKSGKTRFNVNLQQGWGKVGHFVDMMNTRQYLNMRNEAFSNDGLSPDPSKDYDLTLWDTTRYTNWQKTLIGGTAKYTNINADVSGGNATMQYLIGGTFNRQTTVFPGDFDDKRGGLHFNICGNSINQRFKIQLSGNYMYDQNHLLGADLTQQALLLEPNAPALYNEHGLLNWEPDPSGTSTWNNPLVNSYYNDYSNTTKNLITNLNLSYNILPGLDLRSSFGYNNMQTNLYLPTMLESYAPETRAYNDRIAFYGSRNSESWIVEPQLQYRKKVGQGDLECLLGTSIQQAKADVLSIAGIGYSSDLLMKSLIAAQSVVASSSQITETKFNALFGRLNYILKDKYIVNLTARRDGSSKFGDANKLHNFGSVGFGWIFSEEKWLQSHFSFLSFGKLRGSYGTTGNDQIGDFGQLSTYGIVNPQIQYQGITGLQVNSIPNPHLQWEETKKLQGGLDLGFFSNRVNIGATYARNRSTNQIISYVVPSTTGFTTITENLPALVQNTSWELTLSTINLKGKNFEWSMQFNLTMPKNKLLSFPGIEKTSYASGYRGVIVGQPLGVVKVYPYAGVDPNTGNYQLYDSTGKATTSRPGNQEPIFIGNLVKYYGGIQQNFSYRGFQLSINFQYVRKKGPDDLFYNNGFPSGIPGSFQYAGTSNQPITVLNHWQKTGDNSPIGRYTTKIVASSAFPSVSDAWYSYNASFVRVKNISLSWQLPTSLLRKAKFQSCMLYFRGENLLTFTKYHGLDPESGSSVLPPLRLMTVGVQLGL